MSIDRYDPYITASEVDDRIEQLEKVTEPEFQVVRIRNDEVLTVETDEDEAEQYIIDNDYDRERVDVRETEPDEDDVEELSILGTLNADCRRVFGAAWSNGDVTLHNEDYFDSDWARDQAASRDGLENAETDEWPLSLIDWDAAATSLRDRDYACIEFDDAYFYGERQ